MDHLSFDSESPEAPRLSANDQCLHRRRDTLECHQRAVLKVIGAMRKDLSASLDLAFMAGAAFMSRYHFLRVFEEVTGVSPSRFLAALRMERAKRLLLDTSWPVTTICFEVGYNSLGTFTRLFTDAVGVNPHSFRKLREELAGGYLDGLITSYCQHRTHSPPGRTVTGSVCGPADFHGIIFVGLFTSPVPQRRPIGGTLLVDRERFELAMDGASEARYLMAAGFPTGSNITGYLLPSQDELLVASAFLTGKISRDTSPSSVDLTLRRLGAFDPPVVIALPALLKLPVSGR